MERGREERATVGSQLEKEGEREEGGNGTSLEYVSRRRRGELDQRRPRERRASGGACRPTHCIRSTNARCQRSSRAGRARVDDGGDIQKRDVGERKDTSLVAKLNPLIPSNVDARHMHERRPEAGRASGFTLSQAFN